MCAHLASTGWVGNASQPGSAARCQRGAFSLRVKNDEQSIIASGGCCPNDVHASSLSRSLSLSLAHIDSPLSQSVLHSLRLPLSLSLTLLDTTCRLIALPASGIQKWLRLATCFLPSAYPSFYLLHCFYSHSYSSPPTSLSSLPAVVLTGQCFTFSIIYIFIFVFLVLFIVACGFASFLQLFSFMLLLLLHFLLSLPVRFEYISHLICCPATSWRRQHIFVAHCSVLVQYAGPCWVAWWAWECWQINTACEGECRGKRVA